jgi:hypothetical protein
MGACSATSNTNEMNERGGQNKLNTPYKRGTNNGVVFKIYNKTTPKDVYQILHENAQVLNPCPLHSNHKSYFDLIQFHTNGEVSDYTNGVVCRHKDTLYVIPTKHL